MYNWHFDLGVWKADAWGEGCEFMFHEGDHVMNRGDGWDVIQSCDMDGPRFVGLVAELSGRFEAEVLGRSRYPALTLRPGSGSFRHTMKRFQPVPFLLLAVSLGLAGCSTSGLPSGARLVGGGLMINYEAPVEGTAILIERTSGRVVATESLSEGSDFEFEPNRAGYSEVLYRMFASTNAIGMGDVITVPTNTFFQLYFVPAPVK